MIIESLKLTDEEVCDAVHGWLANRGISVPVESVRKQYQYTSEWTVTLVEPKPKVPEPAPSTVQALEAAPAVLGEAS